MSKIQPFKTITKSARSAFKNILAALILFTKQFFKLEIRKWQIYQPKGWQSKKKRHFAFIKLKKKQMPLFFYFRPFGWFLGIFLLGQILKGCFYKMKKKKRGWRSNFSDCVHSYKIRWRNNYFSVSVSVVSKMYNSFVRTSLHKRVLTFWSRYGQLNIEARIKNKVIIKIYISRAVEFTFNPRWAS